jgi:hypothetical protein
VVLGGFPVPDWLRSQALDKLMPSDLHKVVMTRPELADYNAKLTFVKSHMEYTPGTSQG